MWALVIAAITQAAKPDLPFSCSHRCHYEHHVCFSARCSRLPTPTQTKQCIGQCVNDFRDCEARCLRVNNECEARDDACEDVCSEIQDLDERSTCEKKCQFELQCCTFPHPTQSGTMCGNACAAKKERCEAPCFNSKNEIQCLDACEKAFTVCDHECKLADTGCGPEKEACDRACPVELSTACLKMCDIEFTCCNAFPMAGNMTLSERAGTWTRRPIPVATVF